MKIPRAARGRGALALVTLVTAAGLLAAGCGGSAAGPGVPSVGNGTGHSAGQNRATELRAAAQCVRAHGIPGYADPVLTASGSLFTDIRSIADAAPAAVSEANAACGHALALAQLTLSGNPQGEPPAPAQLVQAGVRANECLRAHGLVNLPDPTAQSPYMPGHGFIHSGNELPAGGKASPVYRAAANACRAQIARVIRASTLGSLGNDG